MARRIDWKELAAILKENGVTSLYHYTDRANLSSIEEEGGLYSWSLLDERGIDVPVPGGDPLSHRQDRAKGLDKYIHLSFSKNPPSLQAAIKAGRIQHPVVIEVSLDSLYDESTLFSKGNPQSPDVAPSSSSQQLLALNFASVSEDYYPEMVKADKISIQSEVLVDGFIPMSQLINFHAEKELADKDAKEISKPRALVFLIEQTVSMGKKTFMGEEFQKYSSDAVASAVALQIREALRVWDSNGRLSELDICLVGYGDDCHSAWGPAFAGRDFVAASELYESMTSSGIDLSGDEEQFINFASSRWVMPRRDGWTNSVVSAFVKANELVRSWMATHDSSCFPPTVLQYTAGGDYMNTDVQTLVTKAAALNSIKSSAGPIMLMGIHISCFPRAQVFLPNKLEARGIEADSVFVYENCSDVPDAAKERISSMFGLDMGIPRRLFSVNTSRENLVRIIDVLV